MTNEQREIAILSDIVTRFANLKQSTSRRALLIKFRNQPTSETISNLVNQNLLCRKGSNTPTTEEEYLPKAAAFQFCGDVQLRDRAKIATTIVLHTLQQMFVGEQKKEGFVFDDLKRHAKDLNPNRVPDDATLKLGLYLAKDFPGVLMSYGVAQSDETEVTVFQIGEYAVSMADPEREWDSVMAGFRRSTALPTTNVIFQMRGRDQWDRIEPLGGGGQSDVFLVRTPKRTKECRDSIEFLNSFPLPLTAAMEERTKLNTQFAESLRVYTRPDLPSELGAMKIFKIREGGEQQALDRLRQEIQVLQQNRPGLPKLLDSNESERWIVTEYFPRKTVEDNISIYKGNPALALKAFLSLVNTVAALHAEDIVHRDIKPANVFVRQDDELVLGDFGIVYLPDQPARLTRTNESVGPHDYMPPWTDIGGRLENVHTNFDVYMLGKLLWCMISGRLVLRREWFKYPENDISLMFKHDPHAYMINTILEKCVVERPKNCMSINDLHAMVISFLTVIEQGGQLLQDEVPRPCHVCGFGEYKPELFRQTNPAFQMRFWNLSGGANDINLETVRLFVCNTCGHIEFFRTSPR